MITNLREENINLIEDIAALKEAHAKEMSTLKASHSQEVSELKRLHMEEVNTLKNRNPELEAEVLAIKNAPLDRAKDAEAWRRMCADRSELERGTGFLPSE